MSAPTAPQSSVHGYPRIGPDRELKRATEAYWRGDQTAAQLRAVAAGLRQQNWASLSQAGVASVPTGDFALYDQVLDTMLTVGAIPARFAALGPTETTTDAGADAELEQYFAMARGTAEAAPLEMTKWFDTNYHYLVPELTPHDTFALTSRKPIEEYAEARAFGISGARPVLLGPVTFLRLAKPAPEVAADFDPLTLLDRLLPVYAELLNELAAAGAEWVQMDEPILATEAATESGSAAAGAASTTASPTVQAVRRAYETLAGSDVHVRTAGADVATSQERSELGRPKLVVATYFDEVGSALPTLAALPVEGLGLDFTGRAAANLDRLAGIGGLSSKRLVAGVVDGRNVWINDLRRSLSVLATLFGLADEVVVSTSCSLQHVPLDLDAEDSAETGLDPQIRRWLAFARQKVDEVVTLARGLHDGTEAIADELDANAAALQARRTSALTRDPDVRTRTASVDAADTHRFSAYAERADAQEKRLGLPILPTTTIGSFPQTSRIRSARRDRTAGVLSEQEYAERIRSEIAYAIELQEAAGLDVLVHGEAERNDMVQYFADHLPGFVSTSNGWVQSYGTRYVRPPILVGDVWRPGPITVEWASYAQSLTAKPVKGMLTGPVTMLAWSFVRDDQPESETATQVALALRDEVLDLERAGIGVIQVDEPALRETLPLRQSARPEYLEWAVRAFRLATTGVRDETQIHTHMCYAEFGEILDAVAALDADVISLEAARSHMQIAHELAEYGYPNEVGPGIYDIHSPRVPTSEEIADQLRRALLGLPARRIWVNPDCGLKTRREEEVRPALANLVAAAREVRTELGHAREA